MTQEPLWVSNVDGSACLPPARNVGCFVEHGFDQGRLSCAVAYPIPPGFDPYTAWACQTRVGTRRGPPEGWVLLEATNRLRRLAILVMLTELPKLPRRSRRVTDQRWREPLRVVFMVTPLASSRARLSRRSRIASSPEKVRPTARSASLSARISSHAKWATVGLGCRPSMENRRSQAGVPMSTLRERWIALAFRAAATRGTTTLEFAFGNRRCHNALMTAHNPSGISFATRCVWLVVTMTRYPRQSHNPGPGLHG